MQGTLTKATDYTLEELYELADLGILPSKLGIYGKCDEILPPLLYPEEEVGDDLVCIN